MRVAKIASVAIVGLPFLFLSCACAFPANAAPVSGRLNARSDAAVVELLRVALVRHDEILLSDLLVVPAPSVICREAGKIVVGSAPLPGRQRHISRQEIESVLDGFPELSARLQIPATVEVVRWSRPLAEKEILAAIVAVLDSYHLRLERPLSDSDLQLFSSVTVAEESPGLKIDAIESDPREGVTHLRISVASEPKLPPFWVDIDRLLEEEITVARQPISPGSPITPDLLQTELRPAQNPVLMAEEVGLPQAGGVSRRAFRLGERVRIDSLRPETLVRAGQLVQVVATAGGMRITTTGTLLGAGHRGDAVRVRSTDNGRVFLGTVIGPQTVEVRF